MSRALVNGNGRHADLKDAPWLTAWEMREAFPNQRPVVVEGFIREGEVATLVSGSKCFKTFLVNSLALCITGGRPWLGRYPCAEGSVLYIDNEVHGEEINHRLPQIAEALHIRDDEYGPRLCYMPLRGNLLDVNALDPLMRGIDRCAFKLIIIDALYRAWPRGMEENSNGDVAHIYNTIDRYAHATNAAVLLVHHASKGSQANKAITDVGAGAGSIARAADTHIILRPHEQDACVVMEAETRSFPKPAAVGLRWNFPLWHYDPHLDPAKLRRPGKGGEDNAEPEIVWNPQTFAERFITEAGKTKDLILVEAEAEKLSAQKAERLLNAAIATGNAHKWTFGHKVKEQYATVPQADPLFSTSNPGKPLTAPEARKVASRLAKLFPNQVTTEKRDLFAREIVGKGAHAIEAVIHAHAKKSDRLDLAALIKGVNA